MTAPRRWWRLLRRLGTLERAVCVVLLRWIVIAITIQIVTRYLFGQPLVWVEESAGYAFIWLVFLGAAAGFKELRHIRIDTFVVRLRPRPQHCMRAALYAALHRRDAGGRATTPGRSWTSSRAAAPWRLPIELPRHLFYSVPLFACTVSIALTGAYLVVAYVVSAATGRPVDAELEVVERRRLDEELLNH